MRKRERESGEAGNEVMWLLIHVIGTGSLPALGRGCLLVTERGTHRPSEICNQINVLR